MRAAARARARPPRRRSPPGRCRRRCPRSWPRPRPRCRRRRRPGRSRAAWARAAIRAASTGVAERTTSASASARAARRSRAGLELDDVEGLAQQRQAGLGDRLGDDAARSAHARSAASSASKPALRASSSVAPEVPEAQHLAGRTAAAALDDVAGGEHGAPQLAGIGALRHEHRRHERARLVVGRVELEAGRQDARTEAARRARASAPRSPRGPRRARGRAPRRAR